MFDYTQEYRAKGFEEDALRRNIDYLRECQDKEKLAAGDLVEILKLFEGAGNHGLAKQTHNLLFDTYDSVRRLEKRINDMSERAARLAAAREQREIAEDRRGQ